MCPNGFAHLCTLILCLTNTIFNRKYPILNLNDIYQFEVILRLFSEAKISEKGWFLTVTLASLSC